MKRYKLVKQDNLKDCGVASLASIIAYYNGYVPMEILREKTKTNKQGTTAYNIVEVAKELGFESYGIKCELKDLEKTKLTLPVIAYTIIDNSYKHFLVIYEIDYKKKKVVIADPATKIKKISFSDFEKIYQNILIILYPKKTIPKYVKQNIFLKDVKMIFKQHHKDFLLIFMMTFLFTFLNIISLFFIQNILKGDYQRSIYLICFCFIIFKEIINHFKNKLLIKFSNKMNFALTKQVFFHIIKLPYQYYRNRTSGEVITRLQDVQKLEQFLINILINISINIFLIITTSFFLINISKTLFLISLCIILLYLINYFIFQKPIKTKMEDVLEKTDKTNSFLYESINGFETIKGLNLEDNFIKRFIDKFKNYLTTLFKYQNICNVEATFKNIISSISLITILYGGMLLIKNNLLTLEELFIYNILLSFFIDPIKDIFANTTSIKEIKLIIKRINDLYYIEDIDKINTKIDNVTISDLTYISNNQELFHNLNLSITNKDKIVLIGKSGSGKSTLLKLIKKYYQNNQVLINGDIRQNTNILYISQDEKLFTDTLYNNIVLDRSIDSNQFKKITQICCVNNIIHDEQVGYYMMLEENGFNISGGEKQRIVLARSLLEKADVILLDEALSEVDVNLERRIMKNILKEFKDKTIIYVTHRLDNIDLFKKVFKLEQKNIQILERRNSYV